MSDIVNTTTQNFMRDVIEASQTHLVLVNFWSPASASCKQLTPILEKIVRNSHGLVKLVAMNIEVAPEIAQQLQIQSVPAVFAFKEGKPIDGFLGVISEGKVKEFIEKHLGESLALSDIEQIIAMATEALDAKDIETAFRLFTQVIQMEEKNVSALLGIVQCYIGQEDWISAEQTLGMIPDKHCNDKSVTTIRALLDLTQKANSVGNIVQLQQDFAQNPKDYQLGIDLALAFHACDNREEAVNVLLDIIACDRDWQEGVARKQLLELFSVYGLTDEVTVNGRRRLSSILFC